MKRRHFIKTMLVLAGGVILPISALSANKQKIVIWGQKPFPTSDALRRMHIRRLLLYIEKDVKQIMFSFTGDPNDQVSRDAMIKLTNSFCSNLKQSGARIYDYNTICDMSNNTPEMVDRYEVKLDLYLKFSPAMAKPVRLSFHLKPYRLDVTKEVS